MQKGICICDNLVERYLQNCIWHVAKSTPDVYAANCLHTRWFSRKCISKSNANSRAKNDSYQCVLTTDSPKVLRQSTFQYNHGTSTKVLKVGVQFYQKLKVVTAWRQFLQDSSQHGHSYRCIYIYHKHFSKKVSHWCLLS